MRWIVIPVIVTSLPVGAIPISSPWCVPCALQRLTTFFPSAISSSSVTRRSGTAERIMETNCVIPSMPRTSSSGSCITMVSAYTFWRASSRVSRFVSVTICQERRARALFSSADICSFLLFSPAFPGGLWLHSYIVETNEAQHMSQMHYLLPSRGDAWAESQRVACLYISDTGLLPNDVLGNSEGVRA